MPEEPFPLDDGVDFDGLRVERREEGYYFRTPETEADGLTEDEFRELAHAHSEYVSNWHYFAHVVDAGEAGTAFLRWVERSEEYDVPERYDRLREGVTRTWGELVVTVELEDGVRRYDLRHEDDRGADADELERHDDPLDARGIAKFDDRGRYRPLKTAPTLRTGWVFPALSGRELLDAIGFLYPATVENWFRERRGDLDVSHWRETMERQTGIYGVIETWDRGEGHEHVEWVAEACCVDSQCLKRRKWEYDDETDLDVDGGNGEFPCREPCSLVISGARQWTKLEGEETRTYEFELTESEKEQVEEIVEAVADGRIGEIREADFRDPANRYRARYLRAKRFEDGRIGAPAEEDSGTDETDGTADGQ